MSGFMDSSSLFLFAFLLIYACSAQELLPSQAQALLRIQQLLEYPPALDGWNNNTDFCNLSKTDDISVSCYSASITEVVIVGVDHTGRLSASFSIDRLFTTLSIFPAITSLSLVSLGIWGNLPLWNHLRSLQNLNLSSNLLYGNIPDEISGFQMLETLDLSANFLTGSVPQLTRLDVLRQLDLGSNRLGPEFPVVGSNLVVLNLGENRFMDILPEHLRNMSNLQVLDASHNNLFGSIPSFLFSLPSIKHLGLNGNSLTGDIPENLNCSMNLDFVDISDNKLVGKHQPTCLLTNISFKYSWNCLSWDNYSSLQYPSSYCKPTPSAANPAAKEEEEEQRKKSWRNVASLVLSTIGGIIGCAILVSFVLMLVFDKKTLWKMIYEKHMVISTRSILAANSTPSHMSPEARLGRLGLKIPYRVFDIEELEESTNNFDRSNLLEETSQFHMYQGQIQDGSAVTIKRIRLKHKRPSHALLSHLDVLPKLQHRHLVSILGHCIVEGKKKNHYGTTTTLYLVFEHVANGTLTSHLTEWGNRQMFKWSQRVNVAIGVARGLQFLHTVTTPGICGNDLKIDNIFLDQTLTAKIHNYNLPIDLRDKKEVIVESVMTALKMNNNNCLKNGGKNDIYQLGLILLGVITGEPVSSESQLEAMKHQMHKVVTDNVVNVRQLTDSAIDDTCAYDSVKVVLEVALKCLSSDVTKRPSLDDVVWNLKYSAQVQEDQASREDSVFVDIDVF